MIRRFINASKIEIYQKNPTAVACGATLRPRYRLAVGTYRRDARYYVPLLVGHGPCHRSARR
jgi:hypothetical protein